MKGLKWLNQHSRLLALASVLSLLLSFFLCFIQVKNANALDYNVNLHYEKDLKSQNYTFYYKYGTSGALRSYNGLDLSVTRYGGSGDDPAYQDPVYVRYICSNNSFTFKKGDIVQLTIVTNVTNANTSIGGIRYNFNADDFSILDIKQNFADGRVVSKLKTGVATVMPGSNVSYVVEELYYPFQSVSYDVLLSAYSDGTYPVCLGRSSGNPAQNFYAIPPTTLAAGYTFNMSINFYMRQYSIDNSSQDMNSKDEEDRENIENQQSDSEDSSDDSQEEAESTGTTLLAAFSSFVTAITNASPSNCNLLMNMGNLNLGNVNLCQLSPPPAFQAIASIFMILFCVPLSIATARKVIDLFRSFQT